MDHFSPILFFAYNRPRHTSQSLQALAKCKGAEQSVLNIVIDFPKNNKDQELIKKNKEVISIANEFSWPGKKNVLMNPVNLGVDQSVYRHVSDQLKSNESIIVLEDDLLAADDFLEYMNQSLQLYKNDLRIFSVNGFMFPLNTTRRELMLLPFTSSWGWATWKDRWEKFSFTGASRKTIDMSAAEAEKFNLPGVNYLEMLNEKRECWDINWYYHVFKNGGLNVFPTKSLIFNTGFDGSGVHCPPDLYEQSFNKQEKISTTMIHEPDAELTDLYYAYFRNLHKSNNPTLSRKILRKLRIIK